MHERLDRDSPVPLYHQIAEALRNAVAVGRIRPGERLPAVRAAAGEWGVNLHTVRRAYAELEREGLARVDGARGTVVTGRPAAARRVDLAAFVESCAATARERFGVSAEGLGRLLLEHGGEAEPVVHFLECSRTQAEGHCAELERAWRVAARPLVLGETTTLPAGLVLCTYFHYNDVRQRWPDRLDAVRFVAIGPDASLAERLPADHRVLVCELDVAKAQNIAADLRALLPADRYRIEPHVMAAPGRLPRRRRDTLVLASPRVWGSLTQRQRRAVIEIRYTLRADELELLGRSHGWRRRHGEPR